MDLQVVHIYFQKLFDFLAECGPYFGSPVVFTNKKKKVPREITNKRYTFVINIGSGMIEHY
jgi:hypothetical protein